MKQPIRNLAQRLFWPGALQVDAGTGGLRSVSFLEAVLEGMLSAEGAVNVVQVGANDGSHGDPLNRFLLENRERTRALLVEPQPEIRPHLEAAYADHPGAMVFGGAIGAGDRLVLHRIRPDLWPSFRTSYLKGAPAYRAPSGLTSANRPLVVRAARKYLPRSVDPEEAVEELSVPSRRLPDLLSETGFPDDLHLLQVDAEGADDQVIYACDVDRVRPAAINFEVKHLGEDRRRELEGFLARAGYVLYRWKRSDAIALRRA